MECNANTIFPWINPWGIINSVGPVNQGKKQSREYFDDKIGKLKLSDDLLQHGEEHILYILPYCRFLNFHKPLTFMSFASAYQFVKYNARIWKQNARRDIRKIKWLRTSDILNLHTWRPTKINECPVIVLIHMEIKLYLNAGFVHICGLRKVGSFPLKLLAKDDDLFKQEHSPFLELMWLWLCLALFHHHKCVL